jgi:flagellar FliJ protein
MVPFHFSLDKVLNIRQSVREQSRLELLEALQAEDQIAAQIADLQTELHSARSHTRSTASSGRLNVDELRHTQRYEQSLRGELSLAQTRRQELATEVERRRHVLVEADREVKVLNRLQERQRVHYRIDEARRGAKTLDEQAVLAASTQNDS